MPRYLTRSPAESAVRTAAAEDAGCQLSSKLRRWHRGFREKVFRKGFSSLSFWLVRKSLVNFPLKDGLVQASASRNAVATISQVRPLRRVIFFRQYRLFSFLYHISSKELQQALWVYR